MAGYVKVWTSLRSNDKYLSLPGLHRGAYHQLLLWCKDQRDDGVITASGWTQVGVELGVDRRTARHICDNLAAKLLLTYDKNAQGIISIRFANYKQWQEITVKEVLKKPRPSVQKCTPLRPDQTRPKQTRPDHLLSESNSDHRKAVEYWCSKYLDRFNVKYDFRGGKDGDAIKRLLATFGLEIFCQIVDQIFLSDDPFYRTGGGLTLTVLKANANKLAQEIVRQDSPLDKLSEKGRRTAVNIANVLRKREQV